MPARFFRRAPNLANAADPRALCVAEMSRLFIAAAPLFSSLEAFSAEVQPGPGSGRAFPQAVKAKCRYMASVEP